jgi:Protein of unknown function (DUF1266)
MSVLKSVTGFFVEALTPNWAKKRLAASKTLTMNQRWALAVAAQLTAVNGDSHDTLNPDPVKDSADWGVALNQWWDVSDHEEATEQLQSLKNGGHRVQFRQVLDHDVLAWDLVRLINVARWGYAARYLQEDEAWSYILDAAAQLHGAYGSWEELAQDYVLGHDVWAGEPDEQFNRVTAELLDTDNPGSPWNRVAWNDFRNLQ